MATIYLGGGTPSVLDDQQILRLLTALPKAEEVTIESNPGDISPARLQLWRQAGANRLSIGVQSFNDSMLSLIGRRHTAEQAVQAVRDAQQAGFRNISIDLIYGLPDQSIGDWRHELECALQLGVQHLSVYCLTYEAGTPLTILRDRGIVREADEDLANDMLALAHLMLTQAGFEHYEVSNFARPRFRSRHNSNYWNFTPYIGLGAAAHSFDGHTRSWNVADIDAYMDAILQGTLPSSSEVLTADDRYNEQVMLRLRTVEGLDLTTIVEPYRTHCVSEAESLVAQRLLEYISPTNLRATVAGINLLNLIIEKLMV